MYRLSLIFFTLVVLVAGCKQPTEVQLKPPDGGNVVVAPVRGNNDSTATPLPVITAPLLPDDADEYAGIILLNSVKYDSAGIRYGAFSWVYFADREHPVRSFMTGTAGYPGLSLPGLTLNGSPMDSLHHLVKLPLRPVPVNAGWEYYKDLTSDYQPNKVYHWQASADSLGAVDVTITSPDTLKVMSPVAGSTVSRNNDLTLRWTTGRGRLAIILSEVRNSGAIVPVWSVMPSRNLGQVVLQASYLKALNGRGAWITFVLANRDEESTVVGYDAHVLVQAASVYNTYVGLR